MSQVIHEKQKQAFSDESRFKFVLAGRRGGKTRMVREDIVQSVWECPPGGEIFYIGPTNQQAYELIWDQLEERFDQVPKLKFKPMISKRRFELPGGRLVYVIGAEKIRRIRGHAVYKAFLDELAFFDADLSAVWKAVRPALSDLRGKAVITTTPNGKGTPAYDFYLATLDKPDWKYFYWRTLDNPYILKDEVEAAKAEMDERSFRQEYEAAWESFEGLAYYNFDENVHLKECKKFDWSYPLAITLDFNVNPTTLVVAQIVNGHVFFRKEYSLKNSSTEMTMKNFCHDFKERAGKSVIQIMGDSTGNNRTSKTGLSDYHYVKEALSAEGFHYQMCVPATNPPVIARVSHMNSWLKNYFGESRITIDPSCKDLIRDLSSQELEGRYPSDKNNLGHKADAASYYVYWQHLITNRKPQASIQL